MPAIIGNKRASENFLNQIIQAPEQILKQNSFKRCFLIGATFGVYQNGFLNWCISAELLLARVG